MDNGNLNFVQKVGHVGGGALGSVIGGACGFCVSQYRIHIRNESPTNAKLKADETAKMIRQSLEDFGTEAAPVLLAAALEGLVSRAMSGSKGSTACGDHCGKKVS